MLSNPTVTFSDIQGVNAYNFYEEPMSSDAPQASGFTPGPPQYNSMTDIVIAYVNQLEQRCDSLERMVSVNSAPPHLEEIRSKNTALEISNRELRNSLAALHDTVEIVNKKAAELKKENSRLRSHFDHVDRVAIYSENAHLWCVDTFGQVIANSPVERGARLVEEAIETAQAVDVPMEMVLRIVRRVYNKPVGAIPQELGGVIVCWAIMVKALNLDPERIMDEALNDCWMRQSEIREKLAKKIEDGVSPSKNFNSVPPSPETVIEEARVSLSDFIQNTKKG